MGLFSWLTGNFLNKNFAADSIMSDSGADLMDDHVSASINPASGLPMMGIGVDVAGNPYGMDISDSLTTDMDVNCCDSYSTFDTFGTFDSFNSFDSFDSFDSGDAFSSWDSDSL